MNHKKSIFAWAIQSVWRFLGLHLLVFVLFSFFIGLAFQSEHYVFKGVRFASGLALLAAIAMVVIFSKILLLPTANMLKISLSFLGNKNAEVAQICKAPQRSVDALVQEIVESTYIAIQENHQEESMRKEMNFYTLQRQISPHFLYNALECIRGQAMLEGAHTIAEITESLSKFFRYSISTKADMVTLDDEISNAFDYLKIQQFRFDNRFLITSEYSITEEEMLDCTLPKLTLQPIIENAIAHGFEKKIGPASLHLSVFKTQQNVILTVSDNGIGIPAEKLAKINQALAQQGTASQQTSDKNNGIAMANVNTRLQLLYGPEYGLSLESVEGMGTDVHIRIPYTNSCKGR